MLSSLVDVENDMSRDGVLVSRAMLCLVTYFGMFLGAVSSVFLRCYCCVLSCRVILSYIRWKTQGGKEVERKREE